MKKTIHKHVLEITDVTELHIDAEAQILSVDDQLDNICMWVLTPIREELNLVINKVINVYIIGTGHAVPKEAIKFIGTVKLYDARLIFHIFTDES